MYSYHAPLGSKNIFKIRFTLTQHTPQTQLLATRVLATQAKISVMSGNYFRNDDDEKLLSSGPSAYSNKRRGWDGDHLELNRQQPTEDLASHVAVDLSQFRNDQIGVGYQAKHVIRQRHVPNASVDMTLDTTTNNTTHEKRKHEELGKVDAKSKSITGSRIQKYLKCDGLRQFRKELASIESSA